MIIEWNAHLFSRNQDRYPFHPRASYIPDASRLLDDPLADYLARMKRDGIDRAVLVHPEPYGDDHRLVLDALQREPDRFFGTCLLYPDDPAAPEKLATLVAAEPRLVAVRFHATRASAGYQYLEGFDDAGVRALWDQAAALGLIVELHIGPDYAASAAEAIRDFPAVPVLIDHLGEPGFGAAEQYDDVLALARFDNVFMKLSGLGHFADDDPPYPSVKPFTRRVVDAFGPGRMVWGSDTPEVVDVHLGHVPARERDKVKGGNLAALLGVA